MRERSCPMIRLMLVDDSPIFSAQLRGMLPWEKEGMSIVADARNGLEAIECLERRHPDLVLTDISMPLMDGIGLIEHIHRYYPALPVIALSAYDDFDYVRSSLKLGAQDYLLKHELNKERLLGAIRGALKAKPPTGDGEGRGAQQKVEEFFVLLLTGWFDNAEKLRKRAAELQIALPEAGFFPVAAGIDPAPTGGADFSEPLRELLREALSGALSGMIPVTNERLLLLETAAFGARHTPSQREELQMASETIWRFFGLRLSFGVGDWCADLSDLPAQYKAACKRYDAMRFLGRRGFIADREIDEAAPIFSISLEEERRLTEQLARGDENAVNATLHQLFLAARRQTQATADVTILFAELLHILSHASRRAELEINVEDVPTLSSFGSMDELQQWFQRRFAALMRTRSQRRDDGYGAYTRAAIDYMHRHFQEHISLKEIAGALNVNASYLSRLFKAETGENLVAYLNALRMDEAQHLLEDTDRPVKEIAEMVGIGNYNHFFALFKKKKGLTPVEYRKGLEHGPRP